MRVLLVRAGALGDLLLLRRTIAALQHARHTVALLAPSGPAAALLGPGPGDVAEVLPWESAVFAGLLVDGVEDARAAERLRRYDVAIVYTRNASLARNVGRLVPRVLQHDPAPPAGLHASVWFAEPLAALDIPALDQLPRPKATREEEREAATVLARLPPAYLAVHPGSGSPRKNWAACNFAAVVGGCAPGEPWLLIQGPADGDAASMLRKLPGAVVASHLRPRVLGAVLARAGAYVGNDSGVSHLAAAWGAPAVVLFGPTDPVRWSPVGERVRIVASPDGDMDRIPVGAVAASVTAQRRLREAGSGDDGAAA